MPTTPSAPKLRKKRIDWDGAWKEEIQQLFPAFLGLLFPAVAVLIDWTQEPVFLEQELRQATRRAKRGKGSVDKLARVRLLDGRQVTLLIHVEFQNQVDPDLIDRLYTYNIRIYALLREQVISLAVLGIAIRSGDQQNSAMLTAVSRRGCAFRSPSCSTMRRSGRRWSAAPTRSLCS